MSVGDVTVVIPNYNRTALLERALKSIATQTCRPSKVIIIDDCSVPERFAEIKEIVTRFKKFLNITLLQNDKNCGANHSRNRGIFEASTKYIAFLDSDDLWMPKKLETQLINIEKAKGSNSKPVLSATGRYRVDASGKFIARQFGGNVLSSAKIRQSNFIGTLSSIIVETWIAKHIHGFDEGLPACQDWDFFIRLSEYVQYVGIAEPLCVYVDHDEERITLNNKKRLKAHLFIYRNHIRSSGDLAAISGGEFYRNIAEVYQELGNSRKAAQFFAKYMTLARAKSGMVSRLVPSAFWHLYYTWRNPPSIKQQRYARYRLMMARALKSSASQFEIQNDRIFIEKMMSHSPTGATVPASISGALGKAELLSGKK